MRDWQPYTAAQQASVITTPIQSQEKKGILRKQLPEKPNMTKLCPSSSKCVFAKAKRLSENGDNPTDPSTTPELENPSHDVSELHIIRRSPDLEALKLQKGRSGCAARKENVLWINVLIPFAHPNTKNPRISGRNY